MVASNGLDIGESPPSARLSSSVRWNVAPRSPRITAGNRSNSRWWNGRYSVSGFGTTYGAERWKTVSAPTRSTIAGTNWIALAPVPTTATRVPSSRHVVAPLRRVERRPGEGVAAGQVRDHRVGELADGGDDHVRVVRRAVGGPTRQAPVRVVVRRIGDLLPGAHQVEQPGVARGPLEVVEDLGLPGVAVAPQSGSATRTTSRAATARRRPRPDRCCRARRRRPRPRARGS